MRDLCPSQARTSSIWHRNSLCPHLDCNDFNLIGSSLPVRRFHHLLNHNQYCFHLQLLVRHRHHLTPLCRRPLHQSRLHQFDRFHHQAPSSHCGYFCRLCSTLLICLVSLSHTSFYYLT